MNLNVRSRDGVLLGKEMARLCDSALADKADHRCATCAFRAGDHVANGSVQTLMSAVKCMIEREPFWCHEHDRPCAGWLAMRMPEPHVAPWEHVEGADADPDSVIHLSDQSGDRHD